MIAPSGRMNDETRLAADRHTEARVCMVATQIAARGVTAPRVLDAVLQVPRHRFVPPELEASAYEDRPLHIGFGQTISQPYIVALMTELLELGHQDRVLEIGTGSGYQAAILSVLAAEVVSVERNPQLAEQARKRLKALGYANVTVQTGDGTLGCPERAPFDAIVVTAGAPRVPESLQAQLTLTGRLVCPVGSRESQCLLKLVRSPTGIERYKHIPCMFVPLLGQEGWTD